MITCYSEGVPDPHFTIMHNGKNITTKNPYTIEDVQERSEGTYTCIAINDLGNDTAAGYLNVTGENEFLDAFALFRQCCRKAKTHNGKNWCTLYVTSERLVVYAEFYLIKPTTI